MFDIIEKFITLSGEAPIIGLPVYLVRFSRCNLDCTYCDTDYKEEINERLTSQELLDDISTRIKSNPYLKVLFTGGEPLLELRGKELIDVMNKLKKIDFYIETNGSIAITKNLKNSHFVVDWKSPSSGHEESFCRGNLKMLGSKDCIKFVVDKNDLQWLKERIHEVKKTNGKIPLFVSCQQGKIDPEELAAFILENNLPAGLSIQLHKIIWKEKTRGV